MPKTDTKRQLAAKLIDNKTKLMKIHHYLSLAGKTYDYSTIDGDGKPDKQLFTDTVTYGINGISFTDIGEILAK